MMREERAVRRSPAVYRICWAGPVFEQVPDCHTVLTAVWSAITLVGEVFLDQ